MWGAREQIETTDCVGFSTHKFEVKITMNQEINSKSYHFHNSSDFPSYAHPST